MKDIVISAGMDYINQDESNLKVRQRVARVSFAVSRNESDLNNDQRD